jgi:hypothetical protein
MKRPKLELSGQQFGHITIMTKAATSRNWVGICACNPDVQREFNGSRLATGKIKHCGCQRVSHGHTSGNKRSPTYTSWQNMIQRCKARAVTEADGTITRTRKHAANWITFPGFYKDMGDRPTGMTLDRINTLGHYTKDNCRWATRLVQDFNKTNTKLHFADPETKQISGSALEWAEWYTRSTNITMTVAEFQTIIKFMTPEQFFCAMSPLSTYAQLRQRILDEKKKKADAMWEEGAAVRAAAEQERFERELEDAGCVLDDEAVTDVGEVREVVESAEEWDGGEALAKAFFKRQREIYEEREVNEEGESQED